MSRDRNPRLAILFPSREIGGAEHYVRTVALAALAREWRVSAAFPASPHTRAFRAELERDGVRVSELRIGQPHGGNWVAAALAAMKEAGRTWRTLRRTRATATLLMLPHPDQAIGAVSGTALFPARSAVVVQLVPEAFGVTRSRRLLYGLARRSGQRWVAVSDDNGDRLAAGLGWQEDAVVRIYNGVDSGPALRGERKEQARAAARAALGLPLDRTVLLTVARLNAQKGLDVLAAAIPRVAAQFPRALWLWAGEGEHRAELVERLADQGVADRVQLLGHRSDVPQLLLAADLFVLPSRKEGLPFALLEAMASGVPVIATDLAVTREILADGVHGRLVAVEDEAALAAAMAWALEHPDEMNEMARAASVRVSERYSAANMIDLTLRLLRPAGRLRPKGGSRRE